MGASTSANEAIQPCPSDSIAVEASKHILFLPLRLDGNNLSTEKSYQDAISAEISKLESKGWTHLPQPHASHWLDPKAKSAGHVGQFDRFSYGEFVYFHPFIQDILYPQHSARRDKTANNPPPLPLTILARTDVAALRITTSKRTDGSPHELKILRLWLCMFEFGVTVAMLELEGDSTNLSEVLNLQNVVRRDYPPYFYSDMTAAEYPSRVVVVDTKGSELSVDTNACHFLHAVQKERVTPLAHHWAHLLSPLSIRGALDFKGELVPENPDAPIWVQTIDERLPSMTFIQTSDAAFIRDEDWARMGSMDGPDSGSPYYSKAFLKESFEKQTYYDRHWHHEPEGQGTSRGTRYAITGYGFVCCGSTKKPAGGSEFVRDVVSHHFSRMYAMMGLLIHAQHAALLSISAHASNLADEQNIDAHKALQIRFSRFVQRFWFSNLSNQIQARELYDIWSRNLGLEALYREVKEQIRDAASDLSVLLQSRQGDAALRLNTMAAIALPATVAAGILGMNVVISDKVLTGLEKGPLSLHAFIAGTVFAIIYGITFLAMWLNNRQLPRDAPESFKPIVLKSVGLVFAIAFMTMIGTGFVAVEAIASCKNRDLAAYIIDGCGSTNTKSSTNAADPKSAQ